MLGLSIAGIINESSAVWSSVLLLVGIVLLLPLGLGPLSRGVAAALPASLRVEAKLAGRHLLSHRSRTTLTVGVVFVAISTGIGLASAVIDNVADVKEWYRKSIVADFFIRATSLDMATGTAADLPDEVGKDLRGVTGVQNIDAIRFVSAKSAGQQVIIVVRNFDDPELMDFDMVAGDETTIRDRLVAGEAVVGSVLAQRANLKPGDELPLETEAGVKKFRVAAVVNDYQAGGLTVYLERAAAQRLLGVGGVDAYTVRVDHERIDQVRDDLHELCGKYGLLLQSFSDIQRKIDGMMAGVVAGLWAMVALALLVAAFGVANTLTMSVLEQTYELGLMRILASTRNQVRMLIFTQAAMIGLLALVPGVLAGVAVAYLIHLATMPVIGHPVQFALHPWLMLGGLAAGLAVVLLAAWLPAERAARIEIPATLRLR